MGIPRSRTRLGPSTATPFDSMHFPSWIGRAYRASYRFDATCDVLGMHVFDFYQRLLRGLVVAVRSWRVLYFS
jgi:hypothetical protein